MSDTDGISRLRKSKYLPIVILLYSLYLVVLFILAIPFISEMFVTEPSYEYVYVNPVIYFTVAAITPAMLGYIILDFGTLLVQFEKIVVTPLKELNHKILGYTVTFLFLQLSLNSIMVIFFFLINPVLPDFSNYSREFLTSTWIISFGFSLVSTLINIIFGLNWTKTNLELPSFLHWAVSYIIYLLVIGFIVFFTQIVNPTIKGILLWAISGIAMIGAFNYFIMFFGFFIVGLEVVVSPMISGGGDAYVGFVFMMGILFMCASLFFPFINVVTFYLGVTMEKKMLKKYNNEPLI